MRSSDRLALIQLQKFTPINKQEREATKRSLCRLLQSDVLRMWAWLMSALFLLSFQSELFRLSELVLKNRSVTMHVLPNDISYTLFSHVMQHDCDVQWSIIPLL